MTEGDRRRSAPRFLLIDEAARHAREGVAAWNAWRLDTPDQRVVLDGAELDGLDLGCSDEIDREDSCNDERVADLAGVSLVGARS